MVMSPSPSVYGAHRLLPKIERTWTQPLSPHAAQTRRRWMNTWLTGLFRAAHADLPVLACLWVAAAARPWLCGRGPQWLWKAMTGQVIEVHGDGTQTRDFTHVD